MAQGLARVTGQTAVCFATSGPGATNVLTAIADAKLDSIPLVCISGQVPQHLIGTDAFQEVDVFGISLPICKHNYLVKSVEELLRIIPEAFRIAASGRPGPIWIDIPKDVQNAVIEIEDKDWPEPGAAIAKMSPEEAEIQAMADMIESAKRPILYLGGGIIHSEATELVRKLVERSQLPSVMTLMALGAIPHNHPLALGMLGMHAAPYTNLALEECDLLIALGARFDDRATGKVADFCPRAKVIHVDIDGSELGKIRMPTLSIRADVGVTLGMLLNRLRKQVRSEWNERITELREKHPMEMPGAEDPTMPYGLLNTIAKYAGSDAIVSTDVGQHQMWTAQAWPFVRPRQWLTSGGLGTMGFGIPAAIGAALSEPNKPVVCISGDGSFFMNNQELMTAAEEGVDVKIFLFNNQSLGLVHQQQTLFYGRRLMASKFKRGPNFVMMAESMGVAGIDLADEADWNEAIERAFSIPGPVLIHAPIDVEEQVLPMVAPGAANRDMIRTRPPLASV